MGKGKQQQSNPPGGSNDDGETLAGSTLEDYFATHKVSGHVSQHLLNIPAENDVMAANDSKGGPDRILAKEVEGRAEQKSEQDDYEDDYESDTSTSKAEPPSEVAGMTLSDYLHVKENDNADAQEKVSRAGSLRALPLQLAASGKKVALTSDVTGMSLDHYLGASPQATGEHKSEENGHAARADKKPSPKVKRNSKLSGPALPQAKTTQQSFAVKGSGLIQGPDPNSNSQNLSSDEESGSASSPSSSLTPFQRRQKRKDKAKLKQQRHAASGSSVSKAILMTEAASSPSTILSVRDREKRKSSLGIMNTSAHAHHPGHHGSHSSASNFQPPLPKLAVSPSVRSLSQKAHDADDNGDDTAEKLPPL